MEEEFSDSVYENVENKAPLAMVIVVLVLAGIKYI